AINSFGNSGCKSQELREKLEDLGHGMVTNVFHATRSTMQHKEKLVKSTGALRSKIYKLTVSGKKELEYLESMDKANNSDSDTEVLESKASLESNDSTSEDLETENISELEESSNSVEKSLELETQ